MGLTDIDLPKADLKAWFEARLRPLELFPQKLKDIGSHGEQPDTGVGQVSNSPELGLAPNASLLTKALRPAAVMVPILRRENGLNVLLTVRSNQLSNHAGQVSFPGGRIDEGETALEAALRETYEEVGILPHHITPVGRLDSYVTGTGFLIDPIVGILSDQHQIAINRAEVDEVFEVPLSFLLDTNQRQIQSKMWQGILHHFYTMTYGTYTIWGATAGILVNMRTYMTS